MTAAILDSSTSSSSSSSVFVSRKKNDEDDEWNSESAFPFVLNEKFCDFEVLHGKWKKHFLDAYPLFPLSWLFGSSFCCKREPKEKQREERREDASEEDVEKSLSSLTEKEVLEEGTVRPNIISRKEQTDKRRTDDEEEMQSDSKNNKRKDAAITNSNEKDIERANEEPAASQTAAGVCSVDVPCFNSRRESIKAAAQWRNWFEAQLPQSSSNNSACEDEDGLDISVDEEKERISVCLKKHDKRVSIPQTKYNSAASRMELRICEILSYMQHKQRLFDCFDRICESRGYTQRLLAHRLLLPTYFGEASTENGNRIERILSHQYDDALINDVEDSGFDLALYKKLFLAQKRAVEKRREIEGKRRIIDRAKQVEKTLTNAYHQYCQQLRTMAASADAVECVEVVVDRNSRESITSEVG